MLESYLDFALATTLAGIGSVLPDRLAGGVLFRVPHDVAICSGFFRRVYNRISQYDENISEKLSSRMGTKRVVVSVILPPDFSLRWQEVVGWW